ncbi:hypothetical protein [Methanobrevibacter sp.]|uniref:hypothetical protein n=1 Tax=Methanobrevibacter sp. TaxID=66852 RepID=UPI00388D249C
MQEKITYEDIERYQHLFKFVPAFLLERMAKKNTNLVLKFHSRIAAHLEKLTNHEKNLLNLILNSDIDDLQMLMEDAYGRSNMKQYKILSDPKYREFVELNIDELRKLLIN